MKKRHLHVYLLLIHLRSGDDHILLPGAPTHLVAGLRERLPDSADNLPHVGVGGLRGLRVFFRGPPAVPFKFLALVLARLRGYSAHLLSDMPAHLSFHVFD